MQNATQLFDLHASDSERSSRSSCLRPQFWDDGLTSGLETATTSMGCALRVSSEVLAYQEILRAAWKWLPYSAVVELCTVTLFTVNLIATLVSEPPSLRTLASKRARYVKTNGSNGRP